VDAAKLERRRERRLEKTIQEEWVKYMQVQDEIRERKKEVTKKNGRGIRYVHHDWAESHFVSYLLIPKELDKQANDEFREEKGEKQVESPIRACSRDTRQSHAAIQGVVRFASHSSPSLRLQTG
jgi:hypothetical protein